MRTSMNYYCLDERDHARESWVLFDLVKLRPKHIRNPELPPAMYQFFGPPPEGDLQMKPEYLPLCCKTCGRYDEDAIFRTGFREPVRIRIKGDFSHTEDRIFVVSDKFLQVVRKAKVRGFEVKPIGKSGWHAFQVTERVPCSKRVMKLVEPFCPECKRAETTTGLFEHLSQLTLTKQTNTFFTTKTGWPSMLWDRDIFLSEDVVQALKKGGIKGGYCNRLWTDEEVRTAEEKRKQGKKWKPPGSTVLL